MLAFEGSKVTQNYRRMSTPALVLFLISALSNGRSRFLPATLKFLEPPQGQTVSYSSITINNVTSPMLTRPHLTTFRPSPSTVSYTVSTASPRQTFPSQFLHHCLLLLRILLGFATLTTLGAKFFNNPSFPLLASLSAYLAAFSWLQIAPLAFTSLFLVFRRFHTGS